jgi:hypothetical protein
MIVGGLAVQAVAITAVSLPPTGILPARPALIMASYVVILFGLWRNRHIPGMALVFLGFALNFAAISANGGEMPVTYEALVSTEQPYLVRGPEPGQHVARSKDILLTREQTRLWPLTDVLETPWPLRRAASIGDFSALAGIATVWVLAMRRGRPETTQPEATALAA